MLLNIQVPPIYPSGYKIVFVGEAPGEEEVKQREGFVGAAGKCLQKASKVAGIEWNACGKSNVVKRRPFTNSNKFREAFYETIEEPIYTKTGKLSKKTKKVEKPTLEYAQWVVELEREIRAQNPNLVVACGNEALTAITNYTGITDYRGSILESKWKRESSGDCFKVLAVEHPSFILHGNPERFWILARDLQKAKREMEFPEIKREPMDNRSKPEAVNFILTELEYLEAYPEMKWTLDVETRAGTLACFAIAYRALGGPYHSFCIPIQTTSGPYWTVEEEFEIWRALDATANSNGNLCNQNIEYDIDYLLRYGVEPSGVYMDTMLTHSILYPELPKDLGFLGSWYLDDVVWWKDDHRDWSGKTKDEALWEYCCKDAVYTLRIVEKIDEELKRRGMWEMYHGRN